MLGAFRLLAVCVGRVVVLVVCQVVQGRCVAGDLLGMWPVEIKC